MRHGHRYSHSLILSPAEDTEVVEEMEEFKRLLNPTGQSKISKISLEAFASIIERLCPGKYRDWIHQFRLRYLDFSPVSDRK